MKRNERSANLRILAAWRQVLAQANHLGAETDDLEILEALPGVRDYIIDQIEIYEGRLNASASCAKNAPDNAQFATVENPVNTVSATGG